MKNSDMPAMPLSLELSERYEQGYYDQAALGLTKREYFAMAAMQGVWTDLMDGCRPQHLDYAVKNCVMIADALLAELEKSQ